MPPETTTAEAPAGAAGEVEEAPAPSNDAEGRQAAARNPQPRDAQDDDAAALRREAAQRRRQLRSTEEERDALRERLDRRDKADVERAAAQYLHDPADFWRAGIELDALRGDDGELDHDLIVAAVQRVTTAHPHYAKVRAARQADYAAGAVAPSADSPSFGERLKSAVFGD